MQSIVYLDQNKWIALARVANGLDHAPRVKDALDFVRGARDMNLACFPLSLAHYMETYSASPGARQRLAGVMLSLSGGTTLAAMDVVLRHELDNVLARRFPERVYVRPLRLLGQGVWHAANQPERRYTVPDRLVDVTDPASEAGAVEWWTELTSTGGEGMVVKPRDFVMKGKRGIVQPAVKVRGREYLRIIYGPEYTAAENLERLRSRALGGKRSLAIREFALGIEGLERFVREESFWRVHECAFAVLALESEPVDPRL